MRKRLTTEEFIERARKVHGDRYDYGLVDYHASNKKVSIRCIKHDRVFEQVPFSHWLGLNGCIECANGGLKYDTEVFISKAKLVHDNKYDYSLVKYVDHKLHVDIVCVIHGKFPQAAGDHLQGRGCPKCGSDRTTASTRKSLEEFIEEALKSHSGKYSYEITRYQNSTTRLDVMCPIHGPFSIDPSRHLNGYGCGKCTQIELIAERTKQTAHLKLSVLQHEVLIGSLLGDGHVSGGNKDENGVIGPGQNSRLVIARAVKDLAYLEWQRALYKEFCTPDSKLIYSDSSDLCKVFKPKSKVSFQTRSLPHFTAYRKEWYTEGGLKIVPTSLELTPMIIAIWFADDGSVHATDRKITGTFHTNGFSVDEVEFLVDLLEERYNAEFYLNFTTQSNGHKQPLIKFHGESAINLFEDIDDAFPISMGRKSKRWRKFIQDHV